MRKVYLVDLASGKALHSESYWQEGEEGKVLLTTTISEHYGVFKSATFNDETATLIEPEVDGSLLLTDLLITSKKKLTTNATVQFYDGTETALITLISTDNPVYFSSNFAGRWQGWKNAYVQVIVSSTVDVTVAVGYVKVPPEGTLAYAAWDAMR